MNIDAIVVHCSDSPHGRGNNAETIHGWHLARKWSGIGYHYVILEDGTVQGELEFRNPVEPGKILLDFDPRGQQIDGLDGSTVILEALFPSG